MSFILYKNDIQNEGAIIDYETKNDTFIRMAIILKRMGIKNNTFFLSLLQPELQGVNPFDKNLSTDKIGKILVECKLNPWYFFREVIRIPAAGDEPIPFQLHRANLAAIWTYLNDVDFGLIQPRQTGKTYVTQSIITYVMFILADNIDIGMFTKDTALLQDNVKRLKELRDCLPWYMVQKSPKDWDRKEGISYAMRKNYYKTYTAATDERAAYKQGRKLNCGLQK